MNTSTLKVETNTGEIPVWAMRAMLLGSRGALELLRSPRMPTRLALLSGPFEEELSRTTGLLIEQPGPDEDEPLMAAWHDKDVIALSIDRVFSEDFLRRRISSSREASHVLRYCVGIETARFVADAMEEEAPVGTKDWRDFRVGGGGSEAAGTETSAVPGQATPPSPVDLLASLVAVSTSYFQLLPSGHDRVLMRSEAVRFLVRQLAMIRAAEGSRAIWVGALGRITRALVDKVRFSPVPGEVVQRGIRMKSGEDVYKLMAYWEGEAGWPFHRP